MIKIERESVGLACGMTWVIVYDRFAFVSNESSELRRMFFEFSFGLRFSINTRINTV